MTLRSKVEDLLFRLCDQTKQVSLLKAGVQGQAPNMDAQCWLLKNLEYILRSQKHASLAQSVERTAFNREVLGSSPRGGIRKVFRQGADRRGNVPFYR